MAPLPAYEKDHKDRQQIHPLATDE